ncbi:hypothetical protein EHF33_12335 [Deinococcus psychrotolerans]|uniref:Uncharacterized protein n=1 Tax=Deinococcus psychrotolerans TaxID=2489213 RepID=A0A3G8YGW6_9DEIO|nr:hypothetical protein [Deinococcus psychrotolerans]AZI43437.1 hypothetical protein EHF33_12335 [Deinococcus psychrotolerans]
MTRAGRTWTLYQRLIGAVAQHYGASLSVDLTPQPAEEELLRRFSADLSSQKAQDLLLSLPLGIKNFKYHHRYISRWGTDRRRLLSEGGNFQLLEALHQEDAEGKLVGLQLSGNTTQQRRQLTEHLQAQLPTLEGHGWLAPAASQGRKVRVFDDRQVVWVYPPDEVEFYEGLHPFVVRSLIARYVPEPGIVADPMSGSGVIAQMATEMGHHVWASDIAPTKPFIAELDLLKKPLGEVLGERYLTSADLVAIHPPRPQSLGYTPERYEAWLTEIMNSCWAAVKAGGYLALIVPIQSDFDVLSRAQQAMRCSACAEFNLDIEELTATHVAVSRDGREGWHVLVLQSPPINEEPAED